MSTPNQPQAPTFQVSDLTSKGLEAATAFAEANQRVIGQLIELSSTAASERLRAFGEMQAAAVEMARAAMPMGTIREGIEDLRTDPLGWYRRGALSALEGGQRLFKLFETNAHIVSRTTERFQGSAERASKEIQDAVGGYVTRVRQIYNVRSN